MGIKKVLRDLGKGIVRSAELLASSVSANIALNKKRNEIKKILLSRFNIKHLNSIASAKGINFTVVDPITGEKQIARTKPEKIKILASKLTLEEVIEFARRHRIKYSDLLEELDRFKAKLQEETAKAKHKDKIEDIINHIKRFKPEKIRDEEDLEKQLYQYLKAKLDDKIPIKRQKKIGPLRIDLLVGSCGIELKIPKNVTHLQRLIGQVRDYSDYIDCLIAVIIDSGKLNGISRYAERLKKMGVIPVIIRL